MTFFSEEYHVSLSVDDEYLAKQLRCGTQTASKCGRSLAFVGRELTSLDWLELAYVVHLPSHCCAALPGQG